MEAKIRILPTGRSEMVAEYSKRLHKTLLQLRPDVDLDDEQVNLSVRLRRAHTEHVTQALIIGPREVARSEVAVYGMDGESANAVSLDVYMEGLRKNANH